MNEFLYGNVVGIVQTCIGHPLDTIKTIYQNGNTLRTLSIKKLYRGVNYPLISFTLTNGLSFYSNDYFYNNYNNHFISGSISGVLISPIINAFDVYKVKKQLNLPINNLYRLPFSGFSATLARESIAMSCYFGTYHYLHDDKKYHPFIAGSIAGSSSWLITYPFDVIKTRIQSGLCNTWKESIIQGNMSRGLTMCLLRSFIVNGFSFMAYEIVKDK